MKNLFNTLLLTAMVLTCHAQKVKPELNLTAGNTYYNVSNVNSTITQTFNGQAVSYTIGISAKTAFKVTGVKDTVYTMEVSYKNIGMKMQSPAGAMDFSSDKGDGGDPGSKVFAAMVDKPFLVTISKSGRILSVKNIENIMTSVFTKVEMDTAQKAQLKTQFMQAFGEQSFKSNLEQTMAIYPKTKVSKSDKWAINSKIESTMTADLHSNYELQDVTDSYYLIHGDAKLITPKDKVSEAGGMPITYDMTGTLLSDTKVDKKTGWVIEAKLNQDLTGSFTIKDNPKVPGGMTVPMTVHSDVVTTGQ